MLKQILATSLATASFFALTTTTFGMGGLRLNYESLGSKSQITQKLSQKKEYEDKKDTLRLCDRLQYLSRKAFKNPPLALTLTDTKDFKDLDETIKGPLESLFSLIDSDPLKNFLQDENCTVKKLIKHLFNKSSDKKAVQNKMDQWIDRAILEVYNPKVILKKFAKSPESDSLKEALESTFREAQKAFKKLVSLDALYNLMDLEQEKEMYKQKSIFSEKSKDISDESEEDKIQYRRATAPLKKYLHEEKIVDIEKEVRKVYLNKEKKYKETIAELKRRNDFLLYNFNAVKQDSKKMEEIGQENIKKFLDEEQNGWGLRNEIQRMRRNMLQLRNQNEEFERKNQRINQINDEMRVLLERIKHIFEEDKQTIEKEMLENDVGEDDYGQREKKGRIEFLINEIDEMTQFAQNFFRIEDPNNEEPE